MDISFIKEKIKDTLIKEIECISVDDLKKIDNNAYEVKIKVERRKKKDNRKTELTKDIMESYEKRLSNIPSRDEGIKFLSSTLKDKLSTEYFAKFMSVSFLKQDNKDYIINKIVEATIGARLRSIAIKGE